MACHASFTYALLEMKAAVARLPRVVVASLVSGGLALVFTAPAVSAGPALQVVPPVAVFGGAGTTDVIVVFRNGRTRLADVQLSWLGDSAVSPTLERHSAAQHLRRLAGNGVAVWKLRLHGQNPGSVGKLYFRVDYQATGGRRTSVVPVTIEAPPRVDVRKLAAVRVATTLQSLDEQHPGLVYLIVSNRSSGPLRVLSVHSIGPAFVHFSRPQPLTIAADQQAELAVRVQAQSRVRPGSYLFVFDALVGWTADGLAGKAHFVALHQAKVGITGASDILTLLGVPSFLLVPGLLVLIAWTLPWRAGLFRDPAASRDFIVDAKTPEYWALAITLSIPFAFLFPLVGGVDYLNGDYGLRDIVSIWLVALGVGFGLYVLSVGFVRRLISLTADNDPRAVIFRLGLRLRPVALPRFVFAEGQAYTAFLLERRRGRGEVWLCPRILVSVNDDAPNGGQIAKEVTEARSLWRLFRVLRRHRRHVKEDWERTAGGPAGPFRHLQEELPPQQGNDALVRLADL